MSKKRPYHNTKHAEARRAAQRLVERAPIARGRRDVLTVLVSLWFRHSVVGHIHPGVEKIARKAKVSGRTVQRAIQQLEAAGVLVPLAHRDGGANLSTHFRVDLEALSRFTSVRRAGVSNCHPSGVTNCHPVVTVEANSYEPADYGSNVVPFPRRGRAA